MSLRLNLVRAEEILSRLNGDEVIGAEIGVAVGMLSAELLHNPNLSLYMIDSWLAAEKQPARYGRSGDTVALMSEAMQEQRRLEAIERTNFAADRRKILQLDSVEAAAQLPDASFDFVFIDADHSYEGCKLDIEAWTPKVRPGGWLAGHDYERPEFPLFGVKRAVDEAVEKNGWSLTFGGDCTWFVRL